MRKGPHDRPCASTRKVRGSSRTLRGPCDAGLAGDEPPGPAVQIEFTPGVKSASGDWAAGEIKKTNFG